MISSVTHSFIRPTNIILSDYYRFFQSLLGILLHDLAAIGFLFAVMFKRSFITKNRAGKNVKVAKKRQEEQAKEKTHRKMDSPLMERLVVILFRLPAQ
jgi:uncharacterized membrane protein YciS (DUF1049 family)